MASSTCGNCCGPKTPAEYNADRCTSCETFRQNAIEAARVADPNLSESDLLYVGRQALGHVQHHSRRNYIDPRDFSAGRGMIPVPPTSGDRGSLPPA